MALLVLTLSVQGAIVLAYPEHSKRGRYLAIWLAFKNSGQIVGGSINLGVNVHRSTGGKISYTTLLAFVILQVLAVPTAFLISNPEQVQREDGTKVKVDERTTTREQFRKLWSSILSKEMGLLIPIFFRVIATTSLGYFLDSQKLSLKARARYGGAFVMVTFSGILVWALILQHEYEKRKPGKLDWLSPGFGRGFGLYIMLNTAGNMVQNYLYWAVGSLTDGTGELTRNAGIFRGIEAWGQCASFGIGSSPFYTVVINTVFWALSIPSAWVALGTIGGTNSPYVKRAATDSIMTTTPDTTSEKPSL
ncbi:hypothetical protein DXG01_012367 [Tephrocybe rancida]|nr:hypothetical protein DXG01_012367 [Tephrocybe rancida]